jgi:hypothetical protein
LKKTANTAHRFLGKYRLLVSLSRTTVDEYAEAQSTAHAITSVIGDEGGGSPSRDKMADAAIRMLEHADSVEARSRELDEAWGARLKVIEAVAGRHPLWGDVLDCLYVRGMSVSETGAWLAKDRQHPYERTSLYRLRERALEKAYEEIERLGLLDGFCDDEEEEYE